MGANRPNRLFTPGQHMRIRDPSAGSSASPGNHVWPATPRGTCTPHGGTGPDSAYWLRHSLSHANLGRRCPGPEPPQTSLKWPPRGVQDDAEGRGFRIPPAQVPP
jgi:hypothetical protein